MSEHRVSVVLELDPAAWHYCLACQKPWPCPDAPVADVALCYTCNHPLNDHIPGVGWCAHKTGTLQCCCDDFVAAP